LKDLLKAIRSAILDDELFSYLEGRVYITVETSSASFYPPSFSCPCVVVSPGVFDIEWLPANTTDETKFVQVAAYRYFRETEDALLGAPGEKGVLEMSDDLRKFIVHRDLSLGYDESEVQRVDSPQPFEIKTQNDVVMRQLMTIIYTKFQ